MIMSTTTFGFAAPELSALPTFASQPFPAIETRMQRAAEHVRPFLARLPNEDLQTLGFSPAAINDIRRDGGAVDLIRL